ELADLVVLMRSGDVELGQQIGIDADLAGRRGAVAPIDGRREIGGGGVRARVVETRNNAIEWKTHSGVVCLPEHRRGLRDREDNRIAFAGVAARVSPLDREV